VVDGKQGTIDDGDDGAGGDAVTGECPQNGGDDINDSNDS
jgi:hypothetical protein